MEALKWLWVGVVLALLLFGALGLARWLVQDVTRQPAKTRDRRALKRS